VRLRATLSSQLTNCAPRSLPSMYILMSCRIVPSQLISSNSKRRIFTCALEEHHRLYPTRAQRGRTGERPAWQATIEEAMGMGCDIYASIGDNA
jgi:hypothetical protein